MGDHCPFMPVFGAPQVMFVRGEGTQLWDAKGKRYLDFLAGGLGGFVLPIMFGALLDLTGIRSSAFMLMYGVVWVSLIWMYLSEVRKTPVMGSGSTGPMNSAS